jgi:hypothetical protein
MPAFGGFMNALGQAFGGYAQDEKGRRDDARRAQQLAMQQATQAREQQLANAQIGNYQSENQRRQAEIAAMQQKAQANQRAHGMLQQMGHPMAVGDYNPGMEYTPTLTEALKEQQGKAQYTARQKAAFNLMQKIAPDDPAVKGGFDDSNPANFEDAFKAFSEARRQSASDGRLDKRLAAMQPHMVQVTQNGQTVWVPASEASGMQVGARAGGAGESVDVASTRKDLKGFQSQQIRAESDVRNSNSDIRRLLADHPRASQPLSAQHTAVDSTLANQYGGLQETAADAMKRKQRLTQSADSTQAVLGGLRAAPPTAPVAPGTPPVGAPPPAAPVMPHADRIARAQHENDGFNQAVKQIDANIKDPAQRLAAKRQAMLILNQRMQKLNAGIDPDGE